MHLTTQQIHEAVRDPEWQKVRLSMKGETTRQKLDICRDWLESSPGVEASKIRLVQVQNYLNALSRGGLVAPLPLQLPVAEQIERAVILR